MACPRSLRGVVGGIIATPTVQLVNSLLTSEVDSSSQGDDSAPVVWGLPLEFRMRVAVLAIVMSGDFILLSVIR